MLSDCHVGYMYRMSTKFGISSSSRFSFTARTDRHTHTHTQLTTSQLLYAPSLEAMLVCVSLRDLMQVQRANEH